MGRKKRALHLWSARDLALAECVKSLGQDAAREAVECFTAVSQDSSDCGPTSDQFIPWMSDLLSGVERKYEVRITGRLAALLWISSGARPVTSEDRFDRIRKNWDEAIRRARKRERIGGPGLFDSPVASFHRALLRSEQYSQPRAKASAEQVRARLEYEFERLGRTAQRLTLRDLNVLLRKVLRLRADLRRRPRI